jgi:hypothetical protein
MRPATISIKLNVVRDHLPVLTNIYPAPAHSTLTYPLHFSLTSINLPLPATKKTPSHHPHSCYNHKPRRTRLQLFSWQGGGRVAWMRMMGADSVSSSTVLAFYAVPSKPKKPAPIAFAASPGALQPHRRSCSGGASDLMSCRPRRRFPRVPSFEPDPTSMAGPPRESPEHRRLRLLSEHRSNICARSATERRSVASRSSWASGERPDAPSPW